MRVELTLKQTNAVKTIVHEFIGSTSHDAVERFVTDILRVLEPEFGVGDSIDEAFIETAESASKNDPDCGYDYDR